MVNAIKRIFKDYFVTGLLVLGPLLISALIVKGIIDGAESALQTARWLPVPIPGIGFIISIILILFAGFLGRNVFGKYLFLGAGDLVGRIPVIGAVYSSTKQVFETLLGDQHKNFGRVVLIPYPSTSTWTLAFVTSETVPDGVQNHLEQRLLSVYVPTTPNPTSGFYLFVPHNTAIHTELSVDEAFKLIVSLGLVHQAHKE